MLTFSIFETAFGISVTKPRRHDNKKTSSTGVVSPALRANRSRIGSRQDEGAA